MIDYLQAALFGIYFAVMMFGGALLGSLLYPALVKWEERRKAAREDLNQ